MNSVSSHKRLVQKITITGLIFACLVISLVLFKIPLYSGGYFHFGDIIFCLFVIFWFKNKADFLYIFTLCLAYGIADLINGVPIYSLFSIFIRFLWSLSFIFFAYKSPLRILFWLLFSQIIMIFVYFGCDIFFFNSYAWFNLWMNIVQAVVSAIITVVIWKRIIYFSHRRHFDVKN